MTTLHVHPRFANRIRQTALERASAGDRRALDEIAAIEERSAQLQPDLGEAVRDTCRVLKRALATHGAETAGGALIRRFLSDRLTELRTVCETPSEGATAGRGRPHLAVLSAGQDAPSASE